MTAAVGPRAAVRLAAAVCLALPLAGATPAFAQDAPPADTLVLRSRGPELAFIPDRLTATSGTRVVLRYENGGDLPHNLVLVRDEADVDALVDAAYDARESGYVPTELDESMIAYTPLLSPGETAEVELVVPPPGEYTYICLFPGHANMMIGTLRSIP